MELHQLKLKRDGLYETWSDRGDSQSVLTSTRPKITVLPITFRPKAIDFSDPEDVVISHNSKSDVFRAIASSRPSPTNMVMWGPEYLLYDVFQGRFLTFFLGTAAKRHNVGELESSSRAKTQPTRWEWWKDLFHIKRFVPKDIRVPVSVSYEIRRHRHFQWAQPVYSTSTVEYVPPVPADVADAMNSFWN